MSPNPTTAEFLDLAGRLTLYEIDQRALELLAKTWPIIEANVPLGIRSYIERCAAVPRIAQRLLPHQAELYDLYSRHLRLVLTGQFDERYVDSFRRLRQLETRIGLDDARTSITLSNSVLQAAMDALSRHFRYATSKAMERVKVLTRAVAVDSATTVASQVEALVLASEQRKLTIEDAISSFAAIINEVTSEIRTASQSLATASDTMDILSRETASRMKSAASASSQTSERVSSVASAAEELAVSIASTGHEALLGLETANAAASDTQRTTASIHSLAKLIEDVGAIVNLISKIASQTNLLALNATIEASRANIAGKSFSVVASEVKLLANQTTAATKRIAHQIDEIQHATRISVEETNRIETQIELLTTISAKIASSVTEQTTATEEISRNMQDAAASTTLGSAQIRSVDETIGQGERAAREIVQWSDRLVAHANALSLKVSDFFESIRNA